MEAIGVIIGRVVETLTARLATGCRVITDGAVLADGSIGNDPKVIETVTAKPHGIEPILLGAYHSSGCCTGGKEVEDF